MWDVVVGLLIGLIGLTVAFAGLRVFFIALPVLGFIFGFYIGAAVVDSFAGDGFLSSLLGVGAGFVSGIVFGLLAYFFWYVGVLLSAAATGALIGSALFDALGITAGWLVFLAAAAGGLAVVVIAIKIALPLYVVAINTAIAGASAAVAGIMLVIGTIDRSDLGYGLAWAAIESSWGWFFAWLVVAAAGLGAQLTTISQIKLPNERWTTAEP